MRPALRNGASGLGSDEKDWSRRIWVRACRFRARPALLGRRGVGRSGGSGGGSDVYWGSTVKFYAILVGLNVGLEITDRCRD